MSCTKCPHCIRHGTPSEKLQKIEFKFICSLKIKEAQKLLQPKPLIRANKAKRKVKNKDIEKKNLQTTYDSSTCTHAPFPDNFQYTTCKTFQEQFKSKIKDYNLIPINSPHLIDQLEGSFMDLELL